MRILTAKLGEDVLTFDDFVVESPLKKAFPLLKQISANVRVIQPSDAITIYIKYKIVLGEQQPISELREWLENLDNSIGNGMIDWKINEQCNVLEVNCFVKKILQSFPCMKFFKSEA